MKYHIELKEELDKIVTKEVILFFDSYEAKVVTWFFIIR
jgi:hypothetical protein